MLDYHVDATLTSFSISTESVGDLILCIESGPMASRTDSGDVMSSSSLSVMSSLLGDELLGGDISADTLKVTSVLVA